MSRIYAESIGAETTVLETVEAHKLSRHSTLERARCVQVEVLPAKAS